MRRLASAIFVFIALLVAPSASASSDLEYQQFYSDVVINQDLSITVTENIVVNYLIPKHGIFRNIPERNLSVISIKDENGTDYKYSVSGGNIKEIKIGDPERTITGSYLYAITYTVKEAIKEFPDHFELYWNVTGSDWDSLIPGPGAMVKSPFAAITKVKCFAGEVRTNVEDCTGSFESNFAKFNSLVDTGVGSDFTIVVGLDKNNQFIPPTPIERAIDWLLHNWFYLLTPLPFLIPFYYWLKRGRDQRYISENIYYQPEDTSTRTVSIFERKFLPMVYSPIKGLTPAQAGTIIDEKVDIADVVAEITELARLGYLKIKKIPKKGIFGKGDYEFTRQERDQAGLTNYQKTTLEGLFESTSEVVLLSELKNKFYVNLKKIRNELYESMSDKGFFDQSPEKVRGNWIGGTIGLGFVIFFVINVLGIVEENFWPMIPLVGFGVLGLLFAKNMPRRTPKGYALWRQIDGLKWYIDKGAWRTEIAEKKLFIDEILPLAISLGVVGKLAKDMEVLGLAPPSYVGGVSAAHFASDMGSFQSSMGSALASSPGGKGGSGFGGGGGSGGGGGGGGGGGW